MAVVRVLRGDHRAVTISAYVGGGGMKDQDTERARQERDSVMAGMVAAVAVVAAVLFMLGLALPAGGRAVLLVVVAALAVAAVVKHVRDGD